VPCRGVTATAVGPDGGPLNTVGPAPTSVSQSAPQPSVITSGAVTV